VREQASHYSLNSFEDCPKSNVPNCILEFPLIPMNARFLTHIDRIGQWRTVSSSSCIQKVDKGEGVGAIGHISFMA
jgi:hypothetical protein